MTAEDGDAYDLDLATAALLSEGSDVHLLLGVLAKQLADLLEEKFEATGSRGGFMLGHILSLPDDLVAIVDQLVPELQRRGRFRTEYRYKTLRENLLDS